MESPIDPRINKFIFNTVTLALAGGCVVSLLRQRFSDQATLDGPFFQLKGAKDKESKTSALQSILDSLVDSIRTKKGNAKVAITRHASTLVQYVKLNNDGSNSEQVELALDIVKKGFSVDDQGRDNFSAVGGCHAVLSTLAHAHKSGNRRIMEDAATTLEALTSYDEGAVVLPADVPAGAAGAYSLSQSSSTAKMLRVVVPNAPIVFLSAITGVFCNVTGLRAGARAVNKGVDSHSGLYFFLRLLTHPNSDVVENAARSVSHIVSAGAGHEEISSSDNVSLLSSLINVNTENKTISAVLLVIPTMLSSKYASAFFSNLDNTSAYSSLINVWCRAPEKVVRDRSEMVVRLVEYTRADTSGVQLRRLLESNRANIMERKALDEEAHRKQLMQLQKQQMMQQQMMQQMLMQGGGGGLDLGGMGME